MKTEPSQYDHQAQQFLTTNGLRLRATLSDSKPAPWGEEKYPKHHWRVTVWRHEPGTVWTQGRGRITFDFWSANQPSAYTVLACISSDAHCPDTFNDFCAEYCHNPDSISERLKARQTFNRSVSFSRRLRAFFTPSELEQLSTIQ